MKIEVAGVMSRKSGSKFCAIVKDDDKETKFVYDVGRDTTLNQIELLAVKFAALGIKNNGATISTPNQYVVEMMQHEEEEDVVKWARMPKSNTELIQEIRELILAKEIKIVYERNEAARNECKQ
jgi:ribonuclease HI